MEKPIYYHDYLHLDRLLSSQKPKSAEAGKPAHDEMLFIIVHQAYELWFKQILHELNSVLDMFRLDYVDEKSIGMAVSRLHRVTEIQKLLLDQFHILETMTPLDFLEFRDRLVPASGFQSVQFRLLEIKLGIKAKSRLNYNKTPYHQYLEKEHGENLVLTESQPSLFDRVEKWLERTPFLDFDGFRFWERYQMAVQKMLATDRALIATNPTLSEDGKAHQLSQLERTEASFATLLDEKKHQQLIDNGERRLSYKATKSALLIHLYRDQPILQMPFRLLTTLTEIDELLTAWRYRHALMVQRMIGSKIGTGGTSGHQYLLKTVEKHKIFTDFFNLSTFLIPRSSLPDLPPDIERELGFYYGGGSLADSTDR